MEPYRLKHVPTGLYLDYKSKCHRLSYTGKIYTSGVNGLNYERSYRSSWERSLPVPQGFGEGRYIQVKKEDFVKEPFIYTIPKVESYE